MSKFVVSIALLIVKHCYLLGHLQLEFGMSLETMEVAFKG